ncbi:PREDICTED: SPX and EXS domain-containing protein 5 isoform X1 [Tarenaya hassleriana]|uniref:SPX and EXS domain-containing protein 5 isoform X1 n=1 Tax=Tarenaya hassleriana TaxID=28532 RepID=UPI00053C8A7D|nr:PREDICTED: SPX and EXS domain-containing protein 5 isoform X1 [Tarenaya hassleriana]
MFGGIFSLPVHLRKSGHRPIIADLEHAVADGLPHSTGENDLKGTTNTMHGVLARIQGPVLLWSLKVVLYFAGLCICGKIGWGSVMSMSSDLRDLFFYEAFLYYNPLLLVTMMVWLWGVNLWVFTRSGVDYAAVFCLGSDHLTHTEIWQCARWMTIIILTSMTAYLHLYSHGEVSLAALQPVLLYCLAVLILILPFGIFYASSRHYLLWTVWRIVFPMQAVAFSDFFLADFLTSMSKVFSDLERSMCRMVHHQVATIAWFEADSVCGSHSVAIPLVLVLPYLFRLFQCVRQYKDSRDVTNIWNAAKYLTAVPVIFLSALKYHVTPYTWTYIVQPAWILFGIANTFFSFFWDVLRDWDLSVFTRVFRFSKPNLCSRLLHRRRWVYAWVIGSNLILRGTWTYKLSSHLRNNYITVFVITALEIFRRFQWAFFRIEKEWNLVNKPHRTSHLHGRENGNEAEAEKLLVGSNQSV